MAVLTRVRLPGWAQDALLAAFVTFVQVNGVTNAAATVGHPAPDGLGYALLAVTGPAMLVRRRWPVPVFLATGVLSGWYYLAGYPDGPTWLGLFVALYTLTAYGDGRRSVWTAAAGITALSVAWLAAADLTPGGPEVGWTFFRIGTSVMAAAMGESVRTRRVIAAEAQRRAEHAERTREEEARRRADAERLRIARDVHDTVAHAIATINVQAGVTAHVLDKRPERAREALETIEQVSAQALRELRATLGVLRDPGDDRRTPAPGFGQLDGLVAMAREAGLEVKVEGAAPASLPDAVDAAAYRILQESVTNVIRHAGPGATVTIAIDAGPEELTLRVTDDGRGVAGAAPDPGHGPGQGIAGMRERCVLLGGELAAGPGADGGFEVRARLPLRTPGVVSA